VNAASVSVQKLATSGSAPPAGAVVEPLGAADEPPGAVVELLGAAAVELPVAGALDDAGAVGSSSDPPHPVSSRTAATADRPAPRTVAGGRMRAR
jgi:hypothetical protein